MTLLHRSLVAIAISASLAGCYTDTEATVPMPENPEPLLPLPAEEISLEIGDSIVNAMKESVAITTLEGEEKRVNVETFKGIEYATQTRFAHSITKELEENVNATAFGEACMQVRSTTQYQSEDCLNLNIWRPAGVDAGADLPVYVFIHGGDFEYGSGSDDIVHGDTIVAQGVDGNEPFIYVSINYRLGQLGTLWIDNDDLEVGHKDGNFGIGDQKRALEWVHNNIAEFGGSTTNVTVMGQGSGAMSIGFLQQDDEIAGNYFQRAIMQSNSYGFEYPTYELAKKQKERFESTVDEIINAPDFEAPENDVEIIKQAQAQALSGLEQLKNWLLGSLSISLSLGGEDADGIVAVSNQTPMSNLMPFAPYLACESSEMTEDSEVVCVESTQSPMNTSLSVPTVLGTNANEVNSSGMLFSVTFLIPTILELMSNDDPDVMYSDDSAQVALKALEWLDDERNIALVESTLANMTADDFAAQEGLSLSAYGVVTDLFFGLKTDINADIGKFLTCIIFNDTLECLSENVDIKMSGHEQIDTALNLTDFYPKSEAALGDAIDNMGKFKTLLNDTLFDGPARHMAATSENAATLYRFDKKPSFNVYNYNTGENSSWDILDVFKTIGCISGACTGSELPFVFNKPMRLDGSAINPNSGEKTLMNEMSRMWFSQALFNNFQYTGAGSDNVLVIDGEQSFNKNTATTYDWDSIANEGIDPKLINGRLTGLENEQLMPWQWYLAPNEEETQE
ncbi:carboxylesterase family protein [Vibrio breoganii]|uniref:carboxylesterase family protein n=1 Tax=Vibrio breoganii TaxID=553239 RepID=UPI000C81DAF4|nr:carboxylesterase family protein [Vibrio breoganii]PMJ49598.1 para-nitrobenzyl esterase [Vibrio breoganii]PMK52070.1 para-nitrobenzyl esterase [Vibrio breoganii]PMO30775.1 para-nitrobenzyl esterase [Vibrio breoganii]PMO32448.1 para-nitrobenzyl esterase [Vibrio breoganii]PMO60780.1 para-nitrobenzyl esterase [Vibrio breoganii]